MFHFFTIYFSILYEQVYFTVVIRNKMLRIKKRINEVHTAYLSNNSVDIFNDFLKDFSVVTTLLPAQTPVRVRREFSG